jgi:hypothetical protein
VVSLQELLLQVWAQLVSGKTTILVMKADSYERDHLVEQS